MSIFSRTRRQSEARAVLEADILDAARILSVVEVDPQPEPEEPRHIETFNRLDLVKLKGTYRNYAGMVLEADYDQDALLIKWYDKDAGAWMFNWWNACHVSHMALGISREEMHEVAREMMRTGYLPNKTKRAQTEVQTRS
jgi:hypothetical protein